MYYHKVEFALPKAIKVYACVPRCNHNLGLSIMDSWHDSLRRSIPFSVFIHLTAVTQFSSSAKRIECNYFSLIFARELNSLPSGDNNVFFSWAGSSEIMQILGLVEICLMHPLDVVKTRFQIQRGKTDPTGYKSLGDCFRTIFQREGLLGFYKGIYPPILAETPKRAVKFFTFEQYKKLLGYASLPPGLAFAVAGLGSGLTEAVVVNPFEVVKVTLQANRNAFTEQPSSFVQARQIIKTDGLGFQGLNKGLTATLGRHGVFNMVYFGFYFNVKNILPVNKVVIPQELQEHAPNSERQEH
ncbi:mitochondrial 2-oxodicarboxylate carrier isoform X3 [Accipiter gentilis]|uniref:mitochondrial 2-oxodicarboxylate carrier isoform X3 n=1 Tax=Astur gentilis TaxID=8957 RepID=UPI00210F2B53|nr:mitochondrial 2-oxodicarboxylate carrier isoform X3 [Accipiter gentilis]